MEEQRTGASSVMRCACADASNEADQQRRGSRGRKPRATRAVWRARRRRIARGERGLRACATYPRFGGAGRARDDRDHARQSRWQPLRLARRSTEHAGGARKHQARLQMHLRGYAARSHRAHLRVATGYGTCALTERRCMESGLWPTAMNYDKTQRRETWQTRVRSLLAGALASP